MKILVSFTWISTPFLKKAAKKLIIHFLESMTINKEAPQQFSISEGVKYISSHNFLMPNVNDICVFTKTGDHIIVENSNAIY